MQGSLRGPVLQRRRPLAQKQQGTGPDNGTDRDKSRPHQGGTSGSVSSQTQQSAGRDQDWRPDADQNIKDRNLPN